MNKLLSTVASLAIAGNIAMAGGDIAPVEPVVTTPEVQEWEFGAEIYLWGASINGTTGTGSPLSIDFNDILDNLRMAGMGTFAARHDKWTFLTDLIYLDANKKNLGIAGPNGGSIDSLGMKSWIVQPIVSYAVHETDSDRFEILAGARYIWIETPLGLSLPNFPNQKISPSDKAWNAIIGVRGTHNFTDKWMGTYHLDIGTGDSDSTWQGIVGLAYDFDTYAIHAGYRYLDWDHGGESIDDLNLGGVFAGVRFKF